MRNLVPILLVLVVFCYGCGQKVSTDDDVYIVTVDDVEVLFLKESKSRFSGIIRSEELVSDYYEQGSTNFIVETQYLNGVKNGLHEIRNEKNGLLALEGYYKNGLRDSLWTSYYPNGKPREQGLCENDKKHGWEKEFYETGNISSEVTNNKGKWDGEAKFYYPNGVLEHVAQYKNGSKIPLSNIYYSEYGDIIHPIGSFHAGGIVFWLDEWGEHGLVCDIVDYAYNADFGCCLIPISGADGIEIGTGAQNTQVIVNADCSDSHSEYRLQNIRGITAAVLCSNSRSSGYSDWFLPSKNELNQMYLNKLKINSTALSLGGSAFSTGAIPYWSSSVDDGDDFSAWLQLFSDGKQNNYTRIFPCNVRAVRAF